MFMIAYQAAAIHSNPSKLERVQSRGKAGRPCVGNTGLGCGRKKLSHITAVYHIQSPWATNPPATTGKRRTGAATNPIAAP